MVFNKDSACILVLLSLPFQFNILTDSYDSYLSEMQKSWTNSNQISYYQNYFAKKMTFMVGFVSSISFIFIFYKVRKMRLIISVAFFMSGVTWLLYLLITEDKFYVFIIIRGIQGIYLGALHMPCVTYIFHFANDENKCFCGCMVQVSMFVGLLLLNLLFNFANWKTVAIICAVESFLFCGIIWIIPEFYVKPKTITHEYILKKSNLRNLFIMMLIMLLQQFSGISTLLGQVSRLLSGVGLSIGVYLESVLFDFVGGMSTMIAAFITDYIGTKNMWSFSSLGLCIGLIIYAITLKTDTPNWLGTLGVFVYFLFYGLGEGPTPWYLCGTMFPESVRIESSAIILFENLFLGPILEQLWNSLDKINGQFGSIVFSAVACFLSIFLGRLIPAENRVNIDRVNIL